MSPQVAGFDRPRPPRCRPASLSPTQAAHARELYDTGTHTVAEIAALLGVARTTVYGRLPSKTTADGTVGS